MEELSQIIHVEQTIQLSRKKRFVWNIFSSSLPCLTLPVCINGQLLSVIFAIDKILFLLLFSFLHSHQDGFNQIHILIKDKSKWLQIILIGAGPELK